MENRMQIFRNEQFGEIRTIFMNGEAWFVGKDVCAAFGDTNYRRSLSRLDTDEKGVSQVQTAGGKQTVTVINESGLYSLLLSMQPQKAKGVSQNDFRINQRIEKLGQFRRWLTHDVLPSIRKHGAYATDSVLEQVKEDPEQILKLAEKIVAENGTMLRRKIFINDITPQNAKVRSDRTRFSVTPEK